LTAQKTPVVEFIFTNAKLEGKAQRVQVWLGVMVVGTLVATLLFGLEFVAHALAFFPPLWRTLKYIQRSQQPEQAIDRNERIMWFTYWGMLAFLIVFEAFLLPHAHTEYDENGEEHHHHHHHHHHHEDGEEDDGGSSTFSLLFHLIHIGLMAWAHDHKYKGAVTVYNRLIVPLQTKLGALLAAKPAAAAAASSQAAAPAAGADGKKAN